jgi:hypothetical protein
MDLIKVIRPHTSSRDAVMIYPNFGRAIPCVTPCVTPFVTPCKRVFTGLPEFSCRIIPKRGKMYVPYDHKIPNVYKINQIPNDHQYTYQYFTFLGPPKYTQFGIFGLKIYHLATMAFKWDFSWIRRLAEVELRLRASERCWRRKAWRRRPDRVPQVRRLRLRLSLHHHVSPCNDRTNGRTTTLKYVQWHTNIRTT